MKLAILVLFACALIAGGAKGASLDGYWLYTFPCDARAGLGSDRCAAGENDGFQLTLVEGEGDRLCGDYMLTSGFGNRVDEADVDWPLVRDAHGDTHVQFRFQGGGGEALLHIEGNQMLWRILSVRRDPQTGFWVPPPNLALLTRLDDAALAGGHPKCGAASIARPPSQFLPNAVTNTDVTRLIGSMSALGPPQFVPPGWRWLSAEEEQAHGVCADRLRASSQLALAHFSTLTQASLILAGMTSDHDRAIARLEATSAAGLTLDTLAREKQRAQATAADCSRFEDVKSAAEKLIAGLDEALDATHAIAVQLGAAPPPSQSGAARGP